MQFNFSKISRVVDLLVIFNIVLLLLDLVLVYFASRNVEKLYSELGLQAIYNIGVFNITVRSAIVVFATAAAKYKFWQYKKSKLNEIEKIILTIAFALLLYASYIVIKIFLETIPRL